MRKRNRRAGFVKAEAELWSHVVSQYRGISHLHRAFIACVWRIASPRLKIDQLRCFKERENDFSETPTSYSQDW